jgi:hypothetical protein
MTHCMCGGRFINAVRFCYHRIGPFALMRLEAYYRFTRGQNRTLLDMYLWTLLAQNGLKGIKSLMHNFALAREIRQKLARAQCTILSYIGAVHTQWFFSWLILAHRPMIIIVYGSPAAGSGNKRAALIGGHGRHLRPILANWLYQLLTLPLPFTCV